MLSTAAAPPVPERVHCRPTGNPFRQLTTLVPVTEVGPANNPSSYITGNVARKACYRSCLSIAWVVPVYTTTATTPQKQPAKWKRMHYLVVLPCPCTLPPPPPFPILAHTPPRCCPLPPLSPLPHSHPTLHGCAHVAACRVQLECQRTLWRGFLRFPGPRAGLTLPTPSRPPPRTHHGPGPPTTVHHKPLHDTGVLVALGVLA